MLFGVLGVLCGVLLALAVQSSRAFGASWAREVEATLPTNGIVDLSGHGQRVSSVSCASAGNCTAVGEYTDSSHNQRGVLMTESGGRWAPGVEPALPSAAGSNPNVYLDSVSCASAGDCTAVGKYTDNSGRQQGLLLTQSGGTWAPGVMATLPANAISYPLGGSYLDLGSVSCASAGNCSAVGYYYDSSRIQQGVLLTESGRTWAPGVEATLPTNAGSGPIVSLSSVSCASDGNCAAVGQYTDSSRNGYGLLLTETGGTWTPGVEATLPTNAGSGSIVSLSSACLPGHSCAIANSVSCASAGNCSAVGSYFDSAGNPRGLLLTETNGTWAPGVEAASPGNAQSGVSSVSCASAGNCSAVGAYGLFCECHSGHSDGLLLSETGGAWAAGTDATPPTTAVDASVGSVSCASAGNCTAVGSYADPPTAPGFYNDSHGLLLSEIGGTWAPGVEATPPANAGSPPFVYLGSVSCAPGSNFCSAVGGYTDSSGQQQGLLVSTAAVLSGLRVSPTTFGLSGRRVNRRCVKRTAKNRTHRRCTRPVTLSIGYQLTLPAQVTITIKRALPGRLSNRRCVAPTHKNRTHRRCTRLLTVRGARTINGSQGNNTFNFNGRIGGHKLAPGTYQLTATPAFGSAQTVTFRITN